HDSVMLGEERLADARGPYEQERRGDARAAAEADPGAPQRGGQRPDRAVLADDLALEALLDAGQLGVVVVVDVDPAPRVHDRLDVGAADDRRAVLLLEHGEAERLVQARARRGLVDQ